MDLYRAHARENQRVTIRRMDSFFVGWDGQRLEIVDARGEVRLKDFDVVHFIGWQTQPEIAFVMAHYLHERHIPFIGKTLLGLYPQSKLAEMVLLTADNVSYPHSYYVHDNAKIVALWEWAHAAHALVFPVVVKAIVASKGEDNFLVRSLDELASLPLKSECTYIMQEFIANDKDYRALVFNNNVELVIERRRQNADTHLNNTAQGADAATVSLDDLPADFAVVTVQAARSLGRGDFAGVDLLVDEDTGKVVVLEVNKTPHLALGIPSVIDTKLNLLFAQLDRLAKQ